MLPTIDFARQSLMFDVQGSRLDFGSPGDPRTRLGGRSGVILLAGFTISNMKPLEPSEAFHLQAAQGWLELGNHVEAAKELEGLAPDLSSHPAVLNLRWGILAAAKKWEAALEMAAALIQLDSDDPLGWVHRSYALHELKRTAEARDNLLRVVDKFPISATMRYNLACYECQLGRMEQAKMWLEKAFALGDPKAIKAEALEDRDLEPLWADITKS